jgi:hypothetical protein
MTSSFQPRTSIRATAVLAHALSLLLAVCLGGAPAMAQVLGPFSFTYQGKLEEGGQAYTGQADFEFALFFGTQQRGATIQRPQIEVVDGLFTATLDFGVDIANTVVFDLDGAVTSNPPQIEVRVRAPSGSGGAFTTLSPRQPVTAAPVASSLVGLGRGLTQTLEISQIESNATFQINADINQSLLPTRSAQISAIELRLVNTGAARPVTITLIQGNFTIIATSTATVAGGTPSSGSFVRFDFPPGITLSTSSLYRVGLSTTTTLGARYSTLNPYLDGQANFSSTADLFIRVFTRDSGGFYSTIPFTVESTRSEPLSIIGRHPDGTQVRILNLGGNSANWLLRAVPGTSATQKLRLMPESSSSGAGITIDGLGRVGVGIETPGATLHVAGNIAISQTERIVSVPAFAFVPQGTPAITYTGNGAITAPASTSVTLNAPLFLPHGAVIRRVEMHAIDNDSNDMFGSIRAYSKTASSQLFAISINSSGASSAVRTFSSSTLSAVVNNTTESYVLRANWVATATPANLAFRGMTVYYTIESPLP